MNAKIALGDENKPLTLNCPNNDNISISWLQTLNKTGYYQVEEDSRIKLLNDGHDLSFDFITLSDEEYYICGYFNVNGSFKSVASFYLFVKGK